MKSDNPRVWLPPPLIVVAGLVAGLALDGRLVDPQLNPNVLIIAGLASVASGLMMGVTALGLFRRMRTKPEPWKPASSLVTTGVYRFTRNPMYLGMLLLHGGIALIAGREWTAGALVPVFLILNSYVIGREEAYLKRRFGADYVSYCSQVRRWLGASTRHI